MKTADVMERRDEPSGVGVDGAGKGATDAFPRGRHEARGRGPYLEVLDNLRDRLRLELLRRKRTHRSAEYRGRLHGELDIWRQSELGNERVVSGPPRLG